MYSSGIPPKSANPACAETVLGLGRFRGFLVLAFGRDIVVFRDLLGLVVTVILVLGFAFVRILCLAALVPFSVLACVPSGVLFSRAL